MSAPHAVVVPAIGYVRVSREEQAREDRTSLGHQRTSIAQLAGRLGVTLGTIFEDPGVSGGTAEGRPGFLALVEYCRTHPQRRATPGLVLVLNDSRWGRFQDMEEATYWRVELLKRHGWMVRFVEADDVTDALSRGVIRTIQSAQASAYREHIRANAIQGGRGTAAQGFWQTEAPMGYRREATSRNGAKRVLELGQRKALDERVRLVPGPEAEVALVRWCFTTYAAGDRSLGALVRELERRWPARRWSRMVVQVLLRNPAYVGDVIYGRRRPAGERLGTAAPRPQAEWVVCPDAHPPLVDRELFARVDAVLQQNRKTVRQLSSPYLLSGLITCAHCGEPYIGSGGARGPAGDPDRYRFYRDRGGDERRAAHCSGYLGTLQKRQVEPMVLQAIGDLLASPAIRTKLGATMDRLLANADAAAESAPAARAKNRKRLEAEQARLVDAVTQGVFTAAEASPRMQRLRQELADLEATQHQARFATEQRRTLTTERDRLVALAADFVGTVRRLSAARAREFIASWLAYARFDKFARTLELGIQLLPAGALVGVQCHGGRGKVDRDPFQRGFEARVENGGVNPLPPLLHRTLRQANRLKGGKTIGQVGFDIDQIGIDTEHRGGTNMSGHGQLQLSRPESLPASPFC